jgi:hypothetical protein
MPGPLTTIQETKKMKTTQITSLIVFTFLCGTLRANPVQIFYGGTSHVHDFNTPGTVDTLQGNPAPSLRLNLGAWGASAFHSTDSSHALVLGDIDWSAGGIDFDYMIPTGVGGGIYRMSLHVWTGAWSQITDAFPSISLTDDGTWHSGTIPVSDFNSNYYTLVGNNTINPTSPYQVTARFQANGSALSEFYVDNLQLTLVPEPSTLVLMGLFGLAAYGILRRRKK